MIRLVRLFSTSIGQKLVVALTGAALLGFLLGHMLGNMTVFQGPDTLNAYSAWLQGHPLVWFFRLGLVATFGVHVVATLNLARENRRARLTGEPRRVVPQTSFTSRYMVITGLLVVAFVVYHLLHFTFGALPSASYPVTDSEGRHHVYAMVVGSFREPAVAAAYVVAMVLLGVHLVHGAASLFQTLGINHESYDVLIRYGSYALVVVIVVGFCSIPVLVLAGAVPFPGGP